MASAPVPTSSRNVAVLIHGCHLQAQGTGYDWHSLAFGSKENPGRVPQALQIMFVFMKAKHVHLLYFGTGASRTTLDDGTVELESEHTYRLATTSELQWMADMIGFKADDVLERMKAVSFVDRTTQNTVQEVDTFAEQCRLREISTVIPVSSTSHIQRCLGTFIDFNEKTREHFLVLASPSSTGFGKTVVLEPPHRGDQPKPLEELHPPVIARKMFKLMSNFPLYVEYLEAWNRLTDDFVSRITLAPKSA